MLAIIVLGACTDIENPQNERLQLEGTWKLISATTIQEDSTFTDYFEGKEMIKIINKSHFSFLNHDLNKGQDSLASFVAGGGTYELNGHQYTEHLQFCNLRAWEGHDFTFSIQISNDTLIQKGEEEIEELGVKQQILETYVRLK